ncbi:hypothetical protein B4589_008760 [Halolamina sp. CBA1230]|uniref:hypothetical protein n=1 Tax=Halolamina sp. CBA1230 TaxID=1853690 RepID=UPI0009A22562|nr:hypothetical protein [Halolamina sp. CBA1230]QKY20466.1 hypothetical protein B4589_008760 [Halolamina sp. CBA1230]
MEPRTLGLLGLIGALVGFRLLDRRLDERPSGLLTLGVAVVGGALLLTFAPDALNAELAVSVLLLGLLGAAQVVGSDVSVPTRAFGALAVAVAAGMAVLDLTLFDSGRSLIGATLIGLLGLCCLGWPGAVERVGGTDE